MRVDEVFKQAASQGTTPVSFEMFPPKGELTLDTARKVAGNLCKLSPSFVSVTCSAGGSGNGATTAPIAHMISSEFDTPSVAHLTCVGRTHADIAAKIDEYRSAGVENVLALRGDPPMNGHWDWKDGYFQHAADLVSFTREHEPDMGIGVAAYPAPHPESPSFALDRRYTADKLRAGADFAVSQLFFDVREYEALVVDLRARGLDTPVVPGILPIQSFDSLRRVLSLCGATIPGKLYLSLEEADRKGGAEAVRDAGLDFAVRQICQLLECGAPGIHLYTLNKGDLCLQIAEEVGM